jgi:hypothetical protein
MLLRDNRLTHRLELTHLLLPGLLQCQLFALVVAQVLRLVLVLAAVLVEA